jgi:hypothetical protein
MGCREIGYNALFISTIPVRGKPLSHGALEVAKANQKLGWVPGITFGERVAERVREELKSAERDELVKWHGFVTYEYHE